MKTKTFQDELTGSEYADVQSFEDLRVRFTVGRRILIPQLYDGPLQRVTGRGLPFNSLGVVALPIAALPEGLQGLVATDGLMGEVEKLISDKLADGHFAAQFNDDEGLEMCKAAEQVVGTFCVAGPAGDGIEVQCDLELDRAGILMRGWRLIDDLREEMRNRNLPQDMLFEGQELEVVLNGQRVAHVPTAGELRQKPTSGRIVIGHHGVTGRSRAEKLARHAMGYSMTEERLLANMASGIGWGPGDIRRQKFALTATKIIVR